MSVKKMQVAILCFLRRNSHVLIFTALAFFLRAIPHLSMISMFGVEESLHWVLVNKLIAGNFSYIFVYPNAVHILVAGIRYLFSIPSGPVENFINPLLGALTLPCAIVLMRKFKVSVKQEIIALILITFLEIHIYRTCLFISSEMLGVNLLLLMFSFLISGNWLGVGLILPVLTQAHFLSFAIGLVVVLCYGIINLKSLKKKLILISGIAAAIYIAYIFFPYTASIQNFLYTLGAFNVENIVLLFSPSDYLSVILLHPITILALFGMAYYAVKGRIQFFRLCSLVIMLLGFLSMLFYNPSLIGPYRLILYGGIIGCICLSFSMVKLKKFQLTVVIISLCLISTVAVYPSGLNTILNVNNASTKGEVEAAYWLANFTRDLSIAAIATDIPNFEILNYVTSENRPPFYSGDRNTSEVMTSRTSVVLIPPEQWEENTGAQFIFWSTRMQEHGLFYDVINGSTSYRVTYKATPVADIWSNSTIWLLIYDKDGAKIYERR